MVIQHGNVEKECGASVNGSKDTDNGEWECIIAFQGPDGSKTASGLVEVTVAGKHYIIPDVINKLHDKIAKTVIAYILSEILQ